MAYSELFPKPFATVAADGSSYGVVNNTIYAPSGSGTATFPSEDQTQAWYMYRPSVFSIDTENIPTTQDGLPVTVGLLGPDGLPVVDNVNQFILMIVPVDAVYADVLNDAYLSGDAWAYLIEYAIDNGAIGQIAVVIAVDAANCVNNSRRVLNNLFPANCDQEPYLTENGFLIGVIANAALGQSLPINSVESNGYYEEAQLELDLLNELCALPSCDC